MHINLMNQIGFLKRRETNHVPKEPMPNRESRKRKCTYHTGVHIQIGSARKSSYFENMIINIEPYIQFIKEN